MLKPVAESLLLAALALFGAQDGYVVKGRVQDESGAVARGVQVCAFPEGFDPNRPGVNVPCVRSDASGRFVLAVAGPGKYTLFYDLYADGYWPSSQRFFRHPSSPAPEVVLDESNATASVVISMLPRNGRLIGSGHDAETGQPIDDLEFVLCHADETDVCRRTHAKNVEGRFSIPAPHVPFTLRVRAEGYDDWLGPDGGKRGTTISLRPSVTWVLDVSLKRSATSAGRALSELEKRQGVHLPAPAQLVPADGMVFEHFPRRTRLEWAPVEGAVSYRFEVDYCDGWREGRTGCPDPQPLAVTRAPIKETAYEFDFVGAQPGRWRVWALDAAGREGFKSHWRSFAYLR